MTNKGRAESRQMEQPWPTEVKLRKAEKALEIAFDDGRAFTLAANYLRINSPSAEVRGHGGRKPPPPRGKKAVAIARLEPVGNYAVRLIFDDGHDTGIFSWDYLYEMGAFPERFNTPG